MTKKRLIALVGDADVLIDYAKSAKHVLGLVVQHVCDLYVLEEVFDEVDQLTRRDVQTSGIKFCSPTLQQYAEAAQRGGALSAQDRLCLVMARENGWSCWTNDNPLRAACRSKHVGVVWGLEIMLHLVRVDALEPGEAERIALDIQSKNPRHIHHGIIEKFKKKLREL